MKVQREHAEAFNVLVDTVMDMASTAISEAHRHLDQLDKNVAKVLTMLDKLSNVVDGLVEEETTKEADGPVSSPEVDISREEMEHFIKTKYNPYLNLGGMSLEQIRLLYRNAVIHATNNTWADSTDDVQRNN